MSDLALPAGRTGYLERLPETYRDKYLYAKRAFEDFNLSEELASLRFLMGETLARVEGEDKDKLPVRDVVALCREIRKSMETANKVLAGTSIPIGQLAGFVGELGRIVREEVKDDEVFRRIQQRIGKLVLPTTDRQPGQ